MLRQLLGGGAKIEIMLAAAVMAAKAEAAREVQAPAAARRGAGLAMVAESERCFTVAGAGIQEATVREPTSFTITTTDEKGNALETGGELFFIAIRGVAQVRARVTDNGDGTYTVVWQPPLSGRYDIAVSNFGIPLPGSPFFVTASTPQPCTSKCLLRGDALTAGIARETNTFSISFKDKLGAVTRAVELDVFVEPIPMGSPRAQTAKLTREGHSALRVLPDPGLPDLPSPHKGASNERALPAINESEILGGGQAVLSGSETRKYRKMRVKVTGEKPLVVRDGCALDSEQIGVLMPGAIVTVIEERISVDGVRACVALDYLTKDSDDSIQSERASTSRSSSSTFRAVATERSLAATPDRTPSATNHRGGISNESGSLSTRRGGGTSRLSRAAMTGNSSRGKRMASRKQARSVQKPPTPVPVPVPVPEDTGETDSGASASQSQVEPIEMDEGPTKMAEVGHTGTSVEESGHARVQQRLGLRLDVESAATLASDELPPEPAPAPAPVQQQSSRGVLLEDFVALESEDVYKEFKVGWITLVKNGKKFVTSRVRLDPGRRRQYFSQWERRMVTDKLASDSVSAERQEYKTAAAKVAALTFKSSMVTRSFTMERHSAAGGEDPAAFAFGGVYPGTLHAHGKLQEWHRVSYSIGVAGQYLLHVRLRKQASSLPGSPFMLTISPGRAYALSTRLPDEIAGQVDGLCEMEIETGDKMGNPCTTGGGRIECLCENPEIQPECDDLEDGHYKIRWKSTRTGVFEVSSQLDCD